jgi:hypothetical protein
MVGGSSRLGNGGGGNTFGAGGETFGESRYGPTSSEPKEFVRRLGSGGGLFGWVSRLSEEVMGEAKRGMVKAK